MSQIRSVSPSDVEMDETALRRVVVCGVGQTGKSTLLDTLMLHGDGRDENLTPVAENETWSRATVRSRYLPVDGHRFIVFDIAGNDDSLGQLISIATGADIAVLVADATQESQDETFKLLYLMQLLGVANIVVVINKLDEVADPQEHFEKVGEAFRVFGAKAGADKLHLVPTSALNDDNLNESGTMTWYQGPPLLSLLKSIDADDTLNSAAFRLTVQWVTHSEDSDIQVSGTIVSGVVSRGQSVVICPAETPAVISRISSPTGDLESAGTDQVVTLVLDRSVDIRHGDIVASSEQPCAETDQFAGHVIWLSEEPMLPERQYLMKVGPKTVTAQITDLRYVVSTDNLEHLAGKKLEATEIGYANFALDQSVAFDPYTVNRVTGAFSLIDKYTNETLGFGLINFGLRRATNLTWHESEINKQSRSQQKGQRPCVLWFTGLSGSGKSTVANALERRLRGLGRHSYLLDGDNVRHGLNKDLGFTDQDRVENIRRVAEVSKLMVDAGLIVVVSFISPFRSERQMARELVEDGEFIEVFMDTPLEVCEQRDPKGLYKKARAGEIKNFTGIDSDYEAPQTPEVALSCTRNPELLAEELIGFLKARDYL